MCAYKMQHLHVLGSRNEHLPTKKVPKMLAYKLLEEAYYELR